MRRLLGALVLIGCGTTSSHPDFLGDCQKQPCGAYIPGHGASTVTPTDSGIDGTVNDSGLVDSGVNDSGVNDSGVNDSTITDGTTDGVTDDTGVLDAGDETD